MLLQGRINGLHGVTWDKCIVENHLFKCLCISGIEASIQLCLSYPNEQMTAVLNWCSVTDVMLQLCKQRDHERLMHWTTDGELVLFAVVFLEEFLQIQTNGYRANELSLLVPSLHLLCLV